MLIAVTPMIPAARTSTVVVPKARTDLHYVEAFAGIASRQPDPLTGLPPAEDDRSRWVTA
jgi:hypothetical protein